MFTEFRPNNVFHDHIILLLSFCKDLGNIFLFWLFLVPKPGRIKPAQKKKNNKKSDWLIVTISLLLPALFWWQRSTNNVLLQWLWNTWGWQHCAAERIGFHGRSRVERRIFLRPVWYHASTLDTCRCTYLFILSFICLFISHTSTRSS